MFTNVRAEYEQKRVSADQAVRIVKSGDEVILGGVDLPTIELDKALAKRRDELKNVYLRGTSIMHYSESPKSDPTHEHFILNDLSFSVSERQMQADGIAFFMPCMLSEIPEIIRRRPADVLFVAVTPMDDKGFFNLSIQGVGIADAVRTSKHIVLEVHDTIPFVHGPEQYVHISNVDYVVEVADSKLPVYLPNIEATEVDKKIAMNIMPLITDGACLQLGVGGTPNYVGKMIAESDMKDFGIHTELLASAYFDMFKAGKITNAKKAINKGVSVCTFALGSKELYEFIDHNPLIQLYPADYTNDPRNIMQNDNVISICGCIHMDILGQVSAESVGRKQVSGTGGQVDYHYSAYHSKGGKGIICLQSARLDKKTGKYISNILPALIPGTVVTTPSSLISYVATENGLVNLKGKSTWERAEALVSVAHPECQDQLVEECKKANIWRRSNKR